MPSPHPASHRASERGNIIIIIIGAIILLGLLTVAIRSGGGPNMTADKETTAIRLSEAKRFAAETERGVAYVLENAVSETDLRFAHADAPADYGTIATTPERQIFSAQGGGAGYQKPPSDISSAANWEIYGTTALPAVGTDKADLIAVLPQVTKAFCDAANQSIGYDPATEQPTDAGGGAGCIHAGASSRFGPAAQFADIPNTVDVATFRKPALQGCVLCSTDNSYHYFYVLLAR